MPAVDLPNGERAFFDIDDVPIVMFAVDNKYYAIEDRCSHDDAPLGDGELEGHQAVCPRHGARFDIRNGKALTMPANEDIAWYPTRVVEGMIEIGVKK